MADEKDALERYDNPRLKGLIRRKSNRTHRRGTGLTAAEQKRVGIQVARGIRAPSKYRRYDGRALRSTRPRANEAIRTFYKEVDLPEFKQALEMSPDPKFRMLLFAIANPRLKSCSFGEIVRRCNLTVNDISNLWRNHQVFRGTMKMMNHMPQVMEDVAEDAKTQVVICARCNGEGKLLEETVNRKVDPVCPECHGNGKCRVIGDKDARQLLFEASGLKKGSAGTQVNVNVGAVPTMEQMIEDAENALTIDATPVNGDENGDSEQKVAEAAEQEAGYDSGAAATEAITDSAIER